jgi:hypothetical protein
MSSPASADLSGDGNKEIILVTTGGAIHAISSQTGQDINGWPQTAGSASWNGPIVGDLTGDNLPEVIVANVQGLVSAFARNGSLLFSRSVSNAVRSGILAYDLDNDGNSEVIFADMTGKLYVLDNNGNDIPNFPLALGSSIESTPVLADMNNDGNLEIIFGDSSGKLHSVNIDGTQTENFPIAMNNSFTVSPAIGLISGNETPGILIPNLNSYNYIDYKRPIGEIAWSMFRGNDRRSGNFADLTSVEKTQSELPLLDQLIGNYPNPFNPETTISFSIAIESLVRIDIYNIRGQFVATLLNEHLNTGNHQVVWQGKDQFSRMVSSGLYFYSLQTENFRATKRMMLLK